MTFMGGKNALWKPMCMLCKTQAGQPDKHDFERRQSRWKVITMKTCKEMQLHWGVWGLAPIKMIEEIPSRMLENALQQKRI